MTNKEFVKDLKKRHAMRSDSAISDLRQLLKRVGVDTSAYSARIDPHSAAYILYATCLAPANRSTAEKWILKSAKQFEAKKKAGEFTPVDVLRDLFEDPEAANTLERVVIDQLTGDLYAFAKGIPDPVTISRYQLEEKAIDQPVIRFLAQIPGEYFQAYHRWGVRQN